MSAVKPALSAEALAYLEKQKSLNLVKSSGTQEFVQTSLASSRLPVPESSSPWPLIVGGGLVLAIATAIYVQHRRRVLSKRVLIEPEGRSVFSWSVLEQPHHCADCRYPMKKLDSTALKSHLNQAQQVAQRLGSVKFVGWRCPNCNQQVGNEKIYICSYCWPGKIFEECPNCLEYTVNRKRQTLQQATRYSSGKDLIIYQCQCCSYSRQTKETIQPLKFTSSNSGGFGNCDGRGGDGGGGDGGGGGGGDGGGGGCGGCGGGGGGGG